jgi:hypothetical protein
VVVALVGVAGLAVAGSVMFAWPRVALSGSDVALARVGLPAFAGKVTAVSVRDSTGVAIPVLLRHGEIWPLHFLASGERLTVELTILRPGWVGWLVGDRERRAFTIVTPRARLLHRLLHVRTGAGVAVSFDVPVTRLAIGHVAPRLVAPRSVVALGTAGGAGSAEIAAAARSWERLPTPTHVSWFPTRPYPQVLASPQ